MAVAAGEVQVELKVLEGMAVVELLMYQPELTILVGEEEEVGRLQQAQAVQA